MSIRSVVNQLVGQWQTNKLSREEYRRRTLLIANHWDGSVQQFYHFMLGYLLPLSSWIRRHPGQPVTVRDCGPMNTWFHVLERSVDLETISPGGALHRIVGDRMSYRILQGLDDPSSFDGRKIHEGTDALAELLGIPNSDSVMRDNPRITLIDRQSSDSFYHSTQSETHMSGSERRSTPNLRHIDWRAHTNFDVRVVDFARLDPQAQIRTMRNTNVLIGQHGAGLLHMIWMKPGSAVVEIEPPLPPEVRGIFHRLAHCLGHRYEKIAQQSVHADIDPRIIATTLRRVVAEA